MRVHLIAFGKLRAPGLREATDYYLRNLRPWAEVNEIELKPIPVPDKGAATRTRIQQQEAELVIERAHGAAGERARLFLLDEKGRALTTQQWAERVRDWESGGGREPVLCIGGSLGFGEALRKRAEGLFSLGPQTLPHELARVVLSEQLYRAWSVVRGHPYHNEG